MLIRAVILALALATISALCNEVRSSTIQAEIYQEVKTYHSIVRPEKEVGCKNPIPYLKGSTVVDNNDGTFLVVVSFICGRSA